MASCTDNPEFTGNPEFVRETDHFYRCVPLQKFRWLDHGFSTRLAAGPPDPVITLRQIHSSIVVRADGLTDRQCEGDALVSNAPGKRIGVRTADCVPILLVDPNTKAVGAVHAGWRGTASGIVQHALAEMISEFGSDPKKMRAVIGPSIRACCYEVGAEVANHFRLILPEGLRPHSDEGHVMLDLIEANRKMLRAAGISEEHIYDSRLCTFCRSGEFYSYRREPLEPGRMISYIERRA